MTDKQTILELFLKKKVHLGYNINKNHEVPFYVLGSRKNQAIIDLNFTYFYLKKCFFFLIHAVARKQTILILSENNNILKNYCFLESSRQFFFWDLRKWVPGFLTNFDKLFLNLKSKQNISFKFLKKRPKILLVFNAAKYEDAINEAYLLNIPVIAITDTNCSKKLLSKISYPIPGNTLSLDSIFLFSIIFMKAFHLGRIRYFIRQKRLIQLKLNLQKKAKKRYGFFKTKKA